MERKSETEKMKPELENQLKAILETKQKQNQEAAMSAASRERAEAKNTADFKALKENTIKPAFQEIVKLFQAKQLPIWVSEHEEETNRQGGKAPAAIGLEVFEHNFGANMTPQFKFLYYNGSRTVSLWTSTRSQSGPAREISFETVTTEWIQEKFAEYAKLL